MHLRNILTVYLKELKDAVRDRRTLMSVIIIPTLVMPLMFFGVGKIMSGVMKKAADEVSAVAVIGGEDSPAVLAALKKAPKLKVVATPADWKQAISDKKIRAAVDIPPGFEAGLRAGAAPAVKVSYYKGELMSDRGAGNVEKFLLDLREQTVADRLAEHGLAKSLTRPFEFSRENVAPPEKVGGNMLGGFVPYLIIILCFTGAMYPAMDLTAGEKERGTMETLLCCPVPRIDLVLGKFLLVLTGSLSAMMLSLASMGISAAFAGLLFTHGAGGGKVAAGTLGLAKQSAAAMPMIDPMGLLGVLAMVFPVAVLFSALIFTVSLFAKSYKEAQSYVAPMIFLVIMPAVVGMLPGIDLNARLALVPILNLSLVCKEMLSGIWHWDYIGIIFGSSCVYAAIALALAVKMFNREDVIFRA